MAEVIVKDKNALHDLKDVVLAQTDEVNAALRKFEEKGDVLTKEQAEFKASLEQTRGVLENVNTRMDAFDKMLPKGSKGFPATGNDEDKGTRARRKMGEMIVDMARVARNMPEKYGAISEMRTQKEGNVAGGGGSADASGGLLVPEETAGEIIKLVSNYGLARKLCRIMPMTRDVMRLPMATYAPTSLVGTSVTPSASGAHYNEARAGVQGVQNFTRPELVAARLMVLDNVSLEVDEDSDPSLMNFLVDVFAEAVALAEDWQVLRADMTPFEGVMTAGVTGAGGIYTLPSGSGSFKNISYKDLLQIYNKVDEKIQDNGVWVMSNYVWNQLQTAMVDTNGRPFNLADTQSSVSTAAEKRILSRPVYTSTMMPKASDDTVATKFLIYGDFRYAIFGDRKRMAIDISPHAGFTTGELVMRVMERFAFKAVQGAGASSTGAWAVAKTNATSA